MRPAADPPAGRLGFLPHICHPALDLSMSSHPSMEMSPAEDVSLDVVPDDALTQVVRSFDTVDQIRRFACLGRTFQRVASGVLAGRRRADGAWLGLKPSSATEPSLLASSLRGLCLRELSLRASSASQLHRDALPHVLPLLPLLEVLDLRSQRFVGRQLLLGFDGCIESNRTTVGVAHSWRTSRSTATPPSHQYIQQGGLASATPRLRELDVCFCQGAEYLDCVSLRQRLPTLWLVRRLPSRLCGTTLASPGGDTQTYWADGAFAFTGQHAARGWVAQLREHGPCGDLETRLIFADAPEEGAQADNGRIGVLIRFGECGEHGENGSDRENGGDASDRENGGDGGDGSDGGGDEGSAPTTAAAQAREVLVVQSTRVPEPPPAFPRLPAGVIPALGDSIRGSRLSRRLAGAAHLAGLRLSRLSLRPLPPAAQHAPSEIEAELVRVCTVQPTRHREFEARAVRSMADRRGGSERVAALVQALLPVATAAPEDFAQAALQAWGGASAGVTEEASVGAEGQGLGGAGGEEEDDDLSSSDEEDEEEEDVVMMFE